MKQLLFLSVLLTISSIVFGQKSQLLPDEFFNRNDTSWYNRKTGSSLHLKRIIDGKVDEAIAFCHSQLPDKEADFLLSIAHAHNSKADSAIYYTKQALLHGVPISRYLAGDMPVMQPLVTLAGFQEILKEEKPSIIHGPMLGNVTESSAKVWVRTHGSVKVLLEVSPDELFGKKTQSFEKQTDKTKENIAIFEVNGLKANTRYFYRAKTANGTFKTGSFQTLGKQKFSIAFGACAAHIPWREYMWSTIHSHRPDALFMLGDNVYIDYPKDGQLQLYCYQQRQSNTHWQRLIANTPTYAIWDDHDFGDNDDFGELKKYEPTWKFDNWKRFQNQWANPFYGGGEEDPGVWFNKQMGDVEFFFLDARYYREPSYLDSEKDHTLTMLGPVQKAWLKEKLLASKAKFKVLISSVPWAFPAKEGLEGRIDTWKGYPEERNEIFDFLTENKVEGVFLLSGDRHRADLWEIERENDYSLFEMEVGRLTNTHRHPAMTGVKFSYNKKDAFGKLNFDFTQNDPSVTYEIWSIDNEQIFSHVIQLSQLK